MIAVTDKSIVGGIITFIFLGLFPLAIFLWIFGTPSRRRAKIAAEREAAEREAAEREAVEKQPTEDATNLPK